MGRCFDGHWTTSCCGDNRALTIVENWQLAGARILVTGASSGIGRAAAQLMAAAGARVMAGGRDEGRLSELTASLPGEGHRSYPGVLENADQTAEWVSDIAREVGPLDGIFHAAGVELIRPIRLTKQEHIDKVLSSALHAAFGIARAGAQKGVLNDHASLVFMSSVAGSSGQVGMAAYSAAKAGIEGLVRSLACEMAGRRIRANAIAAGAVETPMHGRIVRGSTSGSAEAYRDSHLLGFGEPEDVANAAIFLLGKGSKWITGTTLVVDGGYLCR